MRLGRVINETPFFPVTEVPVYIQPEGLGTIKVPNRKAIINAETGHLFKVASDNYTIVTHEDVVSRSREVVDKLGLEYTEKVRCTKEGARLYASYMVPTVEGEVSVGDEVKMELIFSNSYDGSKSFTVGLRGHRLVCLNGMTVGKDLFRVRAKHSGEIKINEIIRDAEKAINTYTDQVLPYWRELTQIEVPILEVQDQMNELVAAKQIPEKMVQGVLSSKEIRSRETHTIWNVFNAFTEYTTHTIGRRSYERAQQLGDRAEVFVRSLYNQYQ